MSDTPTNLPPRFLRTPEAARFLGLSGRPLEKHRYFGTGPAYRRIGGRVVYSVDDLRAWADIGIKHSTSDPGQNDLMPRADSAIALATQTVERVKGALHIGGQAEATLGQRQRGGTQQRDL